MWPRTLPGLCAAKPLLCLATLTKTISIIEPDSMRSDTSLEDSALIQFAQCSQNTHVAKCCCNYRRTTIRRGKHLPDAQLDRWAATAHLLHGAVASGARPTGQAVAKAFLVERDSEESPSSSPGAIEREVRRGIVGQAFGCFALLKRPPRVDTENLLRAKARVLSRVFRAHLSHRSLG